MSTRQGDLPTPGGFIGLPVTSLGRVSATALLVGIILAVLIETVFESMSIRIGEVNVVGAITFMVFLVALVTGAIALIRDRERSWAVWLSTGLTALVIGFEILSLLIPGE